MVFIPVGAETSENPSLHEPWTSSCECPPQFSQWFWRDAPDGDCKRLEEREALVLFSFFASAVTSVAHGSKNVVHEVHGSEMQGREETIFDDLDCGDLRWTSEQCHDVSERLIHSSRGHQRRSLPPVTVRQTHSERDEICGVTVW